MTGSDIRMSLWETRQGMGNEEDGELEENRVYLEVGHRGQRYASYVPPPGLHKQRRDTWLALEKWVWERSSACS